MDATLPALIPTQRSAPCQEVHLPEPVYTRLLDTTRHQVIEAAHPKAWKNARDPLAGSKPFSQVNDSLRGEPIDWSAS